jgi:hypothetical protein
MGVGADSAGGVRGSADPAMVVVFVVVGGGGGRASGVFFA